MAPLLAGSAAAALELGDPHLSVVPRTAEEAARVGAVAAPATDFSVPERFEDLPGGAAAVRARTNADAFSQPSANISFEQ